MNGQSLNIVYFINREFFSNLTKLFEVTEMEMSSTAEVLISEYFDEESRKVKISL